MALDMGGEKALSRRALKAELLDAETELRLAYAWRDHRDDCSDSARPDERDLPNAICRPAAARLA